MDIYVFVLFLVSITGSLFIGVYGLRGFIIKKEIYELNAKAEEMKILFKQVQLKLNRLQNELSEIEVNPQETVLEGLQGSNISQIMEALKINPDMLIGLLPPKYKIYAPLIRGFLEGLSKKGGSSNVAQTQNEFPSQV